MIFLKRKVKYQFLIPFIIIFFPSPSLANELNLKTILVNGYEISYYYGGEKIPTFLLIHGLGVDKTSFLSFANLLVRKYRYKLILPDLPGMGNTARINERDYSTESIADFLLELLKILKIKKVILIGNSMGGHIATVFYLKYPQIVKGLVLISPAGIEYQNQKPYQLIDEDSILKLDTILYEKIKWNNKIRNDIQKNKYYLLNDYLSKIQIPTFLFWGTEDTIIPYSYSSVWASEIPNIHFYVIKGGHLLQNEVPEKILNRLFANLTFIKLLNY